MRNVDLDIGFPLDLTLVLSSCFLEEKKALNRHVSAHFPTDQFVCENPLCLQAVQSSVLGRHYAETIFLAPNNLVYM
jgi:hypothetical protein